MFITQCANQTAGKYLYLSYFGAKIWLKLILLNGLVLIMSFSTSLVLRNNSCCLSDSLIIPPYARQETTGSARFLRPCRWTL